MGQEMFCGLSLFLKKNSVTVYIRCYLVLVLGVHIVARQSHTLQSSPFNIPNTPHHFFSYKEHGNLFCYQNIRIIFSISWPNSTSDRHCLQWQTQINEHSPGRCGSAAWSISPVHQKAGGSTCGGIVWEATNWCFSFILLFLSSSLAKIDKYLKINKKRIKPIVGKNAEFRKIRINLPVIIVEVLLVHSSDFYT